MADARVDLPDPQDFDRVLSSMCTPPHPAARAAAERFLATNPGDPATYPAVADLEAGVVDRLGALAGLEDPAGYVTTGGTEANVQAARVARERADTERPAIVAPESAHFSFRKAADVLGMELRTAPVDGDRRADPTALRSAAADADVAMVVAVAGSTEYGRVDPVSAVAEVGRDLDALVHVDAAWGGFVLPFREVGWDFADAPIDTMTIDPHKVGRSAIPAGGLLAREADLLDALSVETPYLEAGSQWSLVGTRSGAGVASAYAALEVLWPDGYREEAERAQALAGWLADELRARDVPVVEPTLPLVAADVGEATFAALRERGWRISRTGAGELRVVCMPHVTRSSLEAFLSDLDELR